MKVIFTGDGIKSLEAAVVGETKDEVSALGLPGPFSDKRWSAKVLEKKEETGRSFKAANWVVPAGALVGIFGDTGIRFEGFGESDLRDTGSWELEYEIGGEETFIDRDGPFFFEEPASARLGDEEFSSASSEGTGTR